MFQVSEFSTHSIQATFHPWDPLMWLTATGSVKKDWGGEHITMLLTACNVPVLLPTDQGGLWPTAWGICSCALQDSHHFFTTDCFCCVHPCPAPTKPFPLLFPAWSWKNNVPPLTLWYKMPNTSTVGHGDHSGSGVMDTAAEMLTPSQSTSPHEPCWLNSLLTYRLCFDRTRKVVLSYAEKDKLVILSIKP